MNDGQQAVLEGIARWHDDYPAKRSGPEEGVFEIGLCMAGAVSAGAYTAGVLDFLIEALDAFAQERERRTGGGSPLHEVRLPVLGGASAGGMCAAMAAVFLDAEFPPVRMDTPEAERERNPLYRAWVSRIDIGPMLGCRDAANTGRVGSLLDCTVLDEMVDELLDMRAGMRAARRPWLATPLRALLTLSNLRGVPYGLGFSNGKARHWMSHHADHVRFAVPLHPTAGAAEPAADRRIKIGETVLDRFAARGSPERERFKAVALGTGGFPVALAPRVLSRPVLDYEYRAALTPTGPLASWSEPPDPLPVWVADFAPAWSKPVADPYSALCVDGGAMNNEPLDLVRRALAGYAGISERDAKKSRRAMLLVDPFVNPAERAAPDGKQGLVDGVFPLFNALVQNARFKPEDLALAFDPKVGSRFLVAPSREGEDNVSEAALASGHLSGFMGFFHKAYREHDFFLGRRNAQRFLQCHFVLPEDNELFTGRWGDEDRAQWRVKVEGSDEWHLPVVPLCGDLRRKAEPPPPWPAGLFDAAGTEARISRRAAVALPAVRDELLQKLSGKGGVRPKLMGGALRLLLKVLTPHFITPRVVEAIMDKLVAEAAKLDGKAGHPAKGNRPAASQGPPR